MKKTLLTIALLAIGSVSFAKWNLIFTAGQFYDSDNSLIEKELNFALIVDTQNLGFSDFKLQSGDSFSAGSYINGKNQYKTLVTNSLDSNGAYAAYSENSWSFDNTAYGFSGGEQVALVIWDNVGAGELFAVSTGDTYAVINPVIASAGTENWLIPTGNSERLVWEMFSAGAGGSLANEFFTLAQKVNAVPEPATYASVFGILALGLLIFRRK